MDDARVCVKRHVFTGVRLCLNRLRYQHVLERFHSMKLVAVKQSEGCSLVFLQTPMKRRRNSGEARDDSLLKTLQKQRNERSSVTLMGS